MIGLLVSFCTKKVGGGCQGHGLKGSFVAKAQACAASEVEGSCGERLSNVGYGGSTFLMWIDYLAWFNRLKCRIASWSDQVQAYAARVCLCARRQRSKLARLRLRRSGAARIVFDPTYKCIYKRDTSNFPCYRMLDGICSKVGRCMSQRQKMYSDSLLETNLARMIHDISIPPASLREWTYFV